MKRLIFGTALCFSLLIGAPASAAGPIVVDGRTVETPSKIYENTTYVPLRQVVEALRPDASVGWEGDRAVVRAQDLHLEAQPGAVYIEANGRTLPVQEVLLEAGCTMVPIRTLAAALGAVVDWEPVTGTVSVTTGGAGTILSGDGYYNADELYWLSRIISAESQGEPLNGKIAVGNVVLNRVANPEFPNTIYGVVFDPRWGGQFEPVRNGTVYLEPTEESILAAKLCLDGAQVAGDSLYFLAPHLTQNHWMMDNRPYVMTIGSHWFYR